MEPRAAADYLIRAATGERAVAEAVAWNLFNEPVPPAVKLHMLRYMRAAGTDRQAGVHLMVVAHDHQQPAIIRSWACFAYGRSTAMNLFDIDDSIRAWGGAEPSRAAVLAVKESRAYGKRFVTRRAVKLNPTLRPSADWSTQEAA